MDKITAIAEKYNLIVVEDGAQAIGSEYEGKRAGSMGDYGCFSFFPSKNLGAFGDGGMVTTNDEEKLKLLKIFRNHGSDPKYYHKYIGGNFRLDALQAVILSIKLKYLDSWSAARQRNAAEYRAMFAESSLKDKVRMPVKADHSTRHIYNQFCILVPSGTRDGLKQHLLDSGIGVDVYYPVPLHRQECFAYLGYGEGSLPVSEEMSERILALPIYPESTTEQRQYVVDTIEKFLK
jgi:dTDP-4-amino-4,6-dideoxygalactose transaminase